MPHAAAKVLVTASVVLAVSGPHGAAKNSRQSSVVHFDRPTWVATAVLMGTYVIEHDDEKGTHGAPCTTVYRLCHDGPTEVVSFHCIPRQQRAPTHFRMAVIADPIDGRDTLTAYQFAGDPAQHGVPVATLLRRDERQTVRRVIDANTDDVGHR